MTRTDFDATIARAAARAATPAAAPTGRSYHVVAAGRDLAPYSARIQAAREGHPRPFDARVLHVEQVDAGDSATLPTYEVVLAE